MRSSRGVMVLAALFAVGVSAEVGETASVGEIAGVHEQTILDAARRQKLREAIVGAAKYEQELVSRYERPTFEMDYFRSEAEHVSFHSPFEGWKHVGQAELGVPDWLATVGFNILLALEKPEGEDTFAAIAVNMGQIEQRSGLSELVGSDMSSEELMLVANILAGNLGVPEKQRFETIGSQRVLMMGIGTPPGAPSAALSILSHGRRLVALLLISSAANRERNQELLTELVKTMDFSYKPADEERIKSIRGEAGQTDDVSVVLRTVRRLAEAGEYNAAAEDLARIRLLLSKQLASPKISGNVARHPAYGVALTNPDPDKWKLSIEDAGGAHMLLLEDKWSVKGEGIGVLVLDTILAYGPQGAEALEDEEMSKELLIAGGRGAAMYVGAIESEQFTTVKGCLAYEAVVGTNAPGGLKVKCLYLMRPGFLVGIMMICDANRFSEKITAYERIVQGDALQLTGEVR